MAARGQLEFQELLQKLVDHDIENTPGWKSNSELKQLPITPDLPAWRLLKWRYLIAIWLAFAAYAALKLAGVASIAGESIYVWAIVFPVIAILIALPIFAGYVSVRSYMLLRHNTAKDVNKYIEFTKPEMRVK